MNADEQSYRESVYEIVRQIPAGKVMTYGQIAQILGKGYTARTIGYVMHAASTANVPWQRVINSHGGCSTTKMTIPFNLQQILLEQEGVVFRNEKCNLAEYRFLPEDSESDNDQPNLFV